jgi:hypothetical protein
MTSIVFSTLGPSGTNHELVARKYVDFHKLRDATLRLADTATAGVEAVRDGVADYFIL